MNTTSQHYGNLENAKNGFNPEFVIVGYKCETTTEEEIPPLYYLEIAPIVNRIRMAYQPLSKKAILSIKDAFNEELAGVSSAKNGWITDEIIYMNTNNTNSALMYYEKAGMQRFFINDEILSLPKPNMVFCVKNDELFVYAYIGNGRPTPETKLFLCPFSNTMSAGKICLGSAKTIQSRESFGNEIAYWKTLYWDSVFESFIGHHVSKKFTLEKFKAAKTFKSEWLVPAKKTVNDLIPK